MKNVGLVGHLEFAREQPFFYFYARWNENGFVVVRTFNFLFAFGERF